MIKNQRSKALYLHKKSPQLIRGLKTNNHENSIIDEIQYKYIYLVL
ncbi:Uncharacterised protein [Chryseobacterium gleum]|uniref:Uncharacterized protein n=1 Tax=Chryseobacterium gleum TaxID=250 RepID=A0A3S4M565_CHRGE|nr:Uncharacterised protein [Chryseobacterium gleum]